MTCDPFNRKFGDWRGWWKISREPAPQNSRSQLTSFKRASESSSFVETQTAKSLTHSGLTEQDLREKVKIYGVGSKQEALKFAAKAIFTEQELIMSSVTGKKTGKSGATPHPPLDAEKLSLLKRKIQEIDPCIHQRYVTEGIQSIQKVLRVKQNQNKINLVFLQRLL